MLLVLRFSAHAPALMPGPGRDFNVVWLFIALGAVPAALVGAICFGIGACISHLSDRLVAHAKKPGPSTTEATQVDDT